MTCLKGIYSPSNCSKPDFVLNTKEDILKKVSTVFINMMINMIKMCGKEVNGVQNNTKWTNKQTDFLKISSFVFYKEKNFHFLVNYPFNGYSACECN